MCDRVRELNEKCHEMIERSTYSCWHPKHGHVLNLLRLSIPHPPLHLPAPFLRTSFTASIMDSDALDASNLSSVYQPLDVLRLELQNEPDFLESGMPQDDYTLTFVSSHLHFGPSQVTFLHVSSLWHTGAS